MRWLTYFPVVKNVHLTKDVGLIPYYVSRFGWDAVLAARFSDPDYPALKKEVRDLKIYELAPAHGSKRKLGFLDRNFLLYLRKQAKKIDVLHLFHLSRDTICYGLLYKILNPQGKLYLKLDAYNDHLTGRRTYARSPAKNAILKTVEARFFKQLDIISIENRKGFDLALQTYPEWKNKLIYLPNGCNDEYLRSLFPELPQKENLILSVGRPGDPDKNYELLLKALPALDFDGWKLIVVGPMSDEFETEWNALIRQHPDRAERIEFTGQISNRDELYALYAKAKVFFLPSRFESFGIAYAEALYFGCVIVGHSGMAAYDDLCDEGRFGTYYRDNDPNSFTGALAEAMAVSEKSGIRHEIRSHASSRFFWSIIVKSLLDSIQGNIPSAFRINNRKKEETPL